MTTPPITSTFVPSLTFVLALLLAGCDTAESPPAGTDANTGNTANSVPVQSDLELLQGRWEIVSSEYKGKKMTLADDPTLPNDAKTFLRVTDNEAFFEMERDGETTTQAFGTFQLNPDTNPKQIDLLRGEDKVKVEAIYELQGDTLRFCAPNGPTKEGRPTQFATSKDNTYELNVLTRVQDSDTTSAGDSE